MKKILPLLLIISMIFSTNITIYGAGDEPSSWAKEDVMDAINRGYVPEHLQNNYQKPITREEFCELFVNTILVGYNENYGSCQEDTKNGWDFRTLTPENFLTKVTTTEYFTDTDNHYVKIANMLGIVNGNGAHKFHPNKCITREAVSVMMVNYLQTVTSAIFHEADKELSDMYKVSNWAESAVKRIYAMGFLKGTKKPIINKDTIIKGCFEPKSFLTREQAILALLEPAKDDKLKYIILRGYVNVSMDELMSGFEIDGNTVKMKKSGYNSRYSLVLKYFGKRQKLKKYIVNHTSEEIDVINLLPYNTDNEMYQPENIEKVLSGKLITYDYGAFSVTFNQPGYLAIIQKSNSYDYFDGGYLLICTPKNTQNSDYVKCQQIIEHEK
ncbi:S-layer homology domain-containing protein [Vallitalea guaymasensis]|uniref:S-layer homology domain-containing protein n=1 Tax=Vallitalea guaymasensis TaxID=1185412 RepID=UPI000DE3FCF4|nr:S-layer homology domain-containing protein [Vallitalea guaymasensis]